MTNLISCLLMQLEEVQNEAPAPMGFNLGSEFNSVSSVPTKTAPSGSASADNLAAALERARADLTTTQAPSSEAEVCDDCGERYVLDSISWS